MIKENQRLLNQLNVISDGIVLLLSFPVAFWIRFHLFHGVVSVPLRRYLTLAVFYTAAQLITYAAFGLYQSFRRRRLRGELMRLWQASALDMAVLLGALFVAHGSHYSRWLLALVFGLSVCVLSCKRIALRLALRRFRQAGFNQKHVLLVGGGALAARYLREIQSNRELGYTAAGYVNARPTDLAARYLGGFDELDAVLERRRPDEVISALELADFHRTPQVIAACEQAGVRLSIIPAYASFMPSTPQVDDLNGIPLLNIRRIPLDNWANAFWKRAMDIVGAGLLLLLLSPALLVCAVGVRLSSPGPVIFRQTRVGLGKKEFQMYKFRSMRMNTSEATGWSGRTDARRTRFGAFLRKCSLDELPQLWNVLKGDMSLVGPRPEVPHFVEQFRDEVPLYMVKHQVRPGITGWAQVHDLRGDTSIRDRIEHDIYYIEHWSLGLDLQILLMTVFKGKFVNDEQLHS